MRGKRAAEAGASSRLSELWSEAPSDAPSVPIEPLSKLPRESCSEVHGVYKRATERAAD